MKLVFLCSSLAPGRDGVGDYVRLMADACREAGHDVRLLALHDRHVTPASPPAAEPAMRRFSTTSPWPTRIQEIATDLADFSPDWVSWHLVPYGFHPRGFLPPALFRLADRLRPLRHHIMLHEVWIGVTTRETRKDRLLGWWQRRRLLAFLRRLQPARLDTSNAAYRRLLGHHGWSASVNPVFGNIPVTAAPPAPERAPAAPWIGVIFGTIHPQWDPRPTLAHLDRAAALAHRPLVLRTLGHTGPGLAHLRRALATLASGRITLDDFGPRPAADISRLLHEADFGLATHPWALLGKSGSAAALLEHGLPVLVPRDEWRLAIGGGHEGLDDPLLARLTEAPPETFSTWLARRRPPASRLPTRAAHLLSRLQPAPRGSRDLVYL